MAITVTVEVRVEVSGEDAQTANPARWWGVGTNSPAQIWQDELQGPTGGTTQPVDNFILVPQPPALMATFFWLDPQPSWGAPASGATFVLKGETTDVGIALSSYNPSLIPCGTTINGGSYVIPMAGGASVWSAPAQTTIDIQSSQTVQVTKGWL